MTAKFSFSAAPSDSRPKMMSARKARSIATKTANGHAWPRPKPEQLLRKVLTEVGLGGRGWSDADLPLLDETRWLLEGAPQPHGHVIVDEAQDLTPMQLRMLARRAGGAITVLGDIAQAAGPIGYRRWEDLLPFLGDDLGAPFQALTPREAKGLEFDRVVLVEPAAIMDEGERLAGLRALYVCLTRATKTLVVVHARPLPAELSREAMAGV